MPTIRKTKCTGSQVIGNFPVYWEIFELLYFHEFCKNIFCKIIEIAIFCEILAMQKFPGKMVLFATIEN